MRSMLSHPFNPAPRPIPCTLQAVTCALHTAALQCCVNCAQHGRAWESCAHCTQHCPPLRTALPPPSPPFRYGCHHCGTRRPGPIVADHQPPNKIVRNYMAGPRVLSPVPGLNTLLRLIGFRRSAPPQRFYPQVRAWATARVLHAHACVGGNALLAKRMLLWHAPQPAAGWHASRSTLPAAAVHAVLPEAGRGDAPRALCPRLPPRPSPRGEHAAVAAGRPRDRRLARVLHQGRQGQGRAAEGSRLCGGQRGQEPAGVCEIAVKEQGKESGAA
jgi:hypothetical protein